MATYTGIADASGNFTIPFPANYTGGQKITITAEKDAAEKSIEIFAPSGQSGGGVIQFSGTLDNFPANIGSVSIDGVSGAIQSGAFNASSEGALWNKAIGLTIGSGVTSVGSGAFYQWRSSKNLTLPNTLVSISSIAFIQWVELLEINIPNSVKTIGDSAFQGASKIKKVTIGSGVASIGGYALYPFSLCSEVICLATTPPTITGTTFFQINTSCVFKVPAASLAAYQAAENWSTYAARMVGI